MSENKTQALRSVLRSVPLIEGQLYWTSESFEVYSDIRMIVEIMKSIMGNASESIDSNDESSVESLDIEQDEASQGNSDVSEEVIDESDPRKKRKNADDGIEGSNIKSTALKLDEKSKRKSTDEEAEEEESQITKVLEAAKTLLRDRLNAVPESRRDFCESQIAAWARGKLMELRAEKSAL